jgi:CelD/BcsL family acetyltransferase involved in cellulose biosynthesis
MVVRVLPVGRLSDADATAWGELQDRDATLASPFFRPEFAQIVAATREDAAVAVVDLPDGRAYLPFQLGRRRRGLPIGGRLSDYHGLVGPPDASVDLAAVVRKAGLRVLEFDAVPTGQRAFGSFARATKTSWQLDLRQGFDAYAAERRRAGSEQLGDIERQSRRLASDVGTLTFEADVRDRHVLETLLRWKSNQYRRTGAVDIFRFPWVVDVIERVQRAEDEAFAGALSALFAGDTLVAAHLGLRSRSIWHYWLPAFDPVFGRYSPGLVLLLELARAAPPLGLEAVDLGKGDALYKQRLATHSVDLLQGDVGTSRVGRGVDAAARVWTRVLQRTPIAPALSRATARRRFS